MGRYRLMVNAGERGKAGDVVELDNEGFTAFPKNVHLKKIEVGEEVKEEDVKEELDEKVLFKRELVNEVGLSPNRTQRVLDKYGCKRDLLKDFKLTFGKLENEALLNYYGKPKQKKKKAIKNIKEDN